MFGTFSTEGAGAATTDALSGTARNLLYLYSRTRRGTKRSNETDALRLSATNEELRVRPSRAGAAAV